MLKNLHLLKGKDQGTNAVNHSSKKASSGLLPKIGVLSISGLFFGYLFVAHPEKGLCAASGEKQKSKEQKSKRNKKLIK